MTESGSNGLFLSTLETWDITADIYLRVQTVYMCFCWANCSKTSVSELIYPDTPGGTDLTYPSGKEPVERV